MRRLGALRSRGEARSRHRAYFDVMRAVLCRALGPPETLAVEDVPAPTPGPHDVLIDVHACGLNFPDVLIIEGKYQVRPDLPFSPGSEVAGTVLEVGSEVEGIEPGSRVLATTGFGGLAEQAVADADRVEPIPDEMDFITASGFLLAYGTSYHALKQRGRLRAGETLLVLGAAGGVGLSAVEIGRAMGARVIAAASTEEKLALAKEHGAEIGINYAEEDLRSRLNELTDGAGVDVILDPVGGDLTEIALRRTAWNGRLLIVGFASGGIPKLPANLPLLKGCEIVGVFFGEMVRREPEVAHQNARELFELYVSGALRPHVSRTYPLAESAEALLALANREALGKLVVEVR
jgi:NADPH:quinone reductase